MQSRLMAVLPIGFSARDSFNPLMGLIQHAAVQRDSFSTFFPAPFFFFWECTPWYHMWLFMTLHDTFMSIIDGEP
jgi:hypothetical protein